MLSKPLKILHQDWFHVVLYDVVGFFNKYFRQTFLLEWINEIFLVSELLKAHRRHHTVGRKEEMGKRLRERNVCS